MAEGGQFPWKQQKIDTSRGPVADYSSLQKPLPKPPKGVEWTYDEPTKEWRLVRLDTEDSKRRFDLNFSETWNPHSGRVMPSIVPVAKEQDNSNVLVAPDTPKQQQQQQENPNDAVENVDYVIHTVLPTDTLQGLCLRYRIKPTVLRQTNKFSGSNLLLAPSKLVIPLHETSIESIKLQDKSSRQYKQFELLAEFPHLRQSEARAYLELSDWDLEEAIRSVGEDEAWEQRQEAKKRQEERIKAMKPTLNVHVAVPAVVDETSVATTKEQEDKGLLEPLLSELELSPRRLY